MAVKRMGQGESGKIASILLKCKNAGERGEEVYIEKSRGRRNKRNTMRVKATRRRKMKLQGLDRGGGLLSKKYHEKTEFEGGAIWGV